MHITTSQTTPARVIGNGTEDRQLTFDTFPSRHFYLNYNAPATVNGTVSSLRYCFVLNTADFDSGDIFLSTVGIYRPRSDGYTLTNTVIVSFNNLDGLPNDINTTFHCREMNVPEFEVQVGDAIGVCLREFSSPESTERINVFANLNNGYMIMSRNPNVDNVCVNPREMPSELSSSVLAPVTNRVPLVSAEINVGTCVAMQTNLQLLCTCNLPSNGGWSSLDTSTALIW